MQTAELTDYIFFGDINMLMEESTTYQYILSRGEDERGKRLLLRQATQRFGAPSSEQASRFQSVNELSKQEALSDRILTAADWDEFLRDI